MRGRFAGAEAKTRNVLTTPPTDDHNRHTHGNAFADLVCLHFPMKRMPAFLPNIHRSGRRVPFTAWRTSFPPVTLGRPARALRSTWRAASFPTRHNSAGRQIFSQSSPKAACSRPPEVRMRDTQRLLQQTSYQKGIGSRNTRGTSATTPGTTTPWGPSSNSRPKPVCPTTPPGLSAR